jgi:hypothetical protein
MAINPRKPTSRQVKAKGVHRASLRDPGPSCRAGEGLRYSAFDLSVAQPFRAAVLAGLKPCATQHETAVAVQSRPHAPVAQVDRAPAF